jgi:hypothetical protein
VSKVAIIIAAAVIAATTGIFYLIGLFDPIAVTVETRGPYRLIYRDYRGPYRGVPFIVNTVYRYAHDTLRLTTAIPFAIYYDEPKLSGGDSLRSIGGVTTDSVPVLKPGVHSAVFGKTDAVVGTFTLRGFFSTAIGSYKFYSALPRYLDGHKLRRNGPAMEVYDAAHRTIYYIAPVGASGVPAPAFQGDP